jgi:pilus assembly protein Flp/PilA
MKSFLAHFAQNESGATAIEYALLAGLMGAGVIASLTQIKGVLNTLFANVSTMLG